MRQLATIQKIEDLQPIPSADAIEVATIKGWKVVVKKGEFSIGDICVFFEIDSFLPIEPQYEFLRKGSTAKRMLVDGEAREGIRLKTIKLRGQISQGLALPLSIFKIPEYINLQTNDERSELIGTDVSEQLNVIKYEPPMSAELSGVARGLFPAFIPKTDEERIQNWKSILTDFRDETFYVTSKLDGTSSTFFKHDGVFGVCSRNIELKDTEGNTHWRIAHELNLDNIIPDEMALQGEIVGEGIQGNPLKISGQKLFLYNIYDIRDGSYLNYINFVTLAHILGIETVPVIDDYFHLPETLDELLEYANAPSPLNPNVPQEGVVIRPLIERVVDNGHNSMQRLSFKVISNKYLLDIEE